MALFKPFRGNHSSLDAQPLHDGYAYFCTDDGTFHIDFADADGDLQRKQITAKEAEALIGYDIATSINSNDAEIPTSKAVKTYVDNAVTNAGSNVELDTTLTKEGKAADAKAVGDAVAELNNKINEIANSDGVVGTWVFNDEITNINKPYDEGGHYGCYEFYVNSTIKIQGYFYQIEYLSLFIDENGNLYEIDANNDNIGLNSILYEHGELSSSWDNYSITFLEEPTDTDFITWLRANATKQSEASPITTLQIPITHSELKTLRDNSELIPGMFYRITDYVCTTSQENTRAIDHKFDIIVQALSANILSENASADYCSEVGGFRLEPLFDVIVDETGTTDGEVYSPQDIFVAYDYAENPDGDTVPVLYKTDINNYPEEADYGDVFYYSGTYELDGVVYDSWRKIDQADDPEYPWDGSVEKYVLTNVIIENGVFIDDALSGGEYFKNSNLSAWELKYCLDNDTTRFAWADNRQYITNLQSALSNGQPLTRQPIFDGSFGDEYYYAWGTQADVDDDDQTSFFYSKSEKLSNDESIFFGSDGELYTVEVSESGKGVIYYMKDEHGNECPYDFKNIQFDFNDKYVYTFYRDDLEEDLSLSSAYDNRVELLRDGTSQKLNQVAITCTEQIKNITIVSGVKERFINVSEVSTPAVYKPSGSTEIILD